MQFVITRIRL